MGKKTKFVYTISIKGGMLMKHLLRNIEILFCVVVLGYTEKEFGMSYGNC